MKNLGILIDKPSHSQKFRFLSEELVQISNDVNVVVFSCEDGIIPRKVNFPIMEMVQAISFNGVLIATDIYTACIVKNALNPIARYFYIYDLEYLYSPYSFSFLQDVYNNPKIKLIARNQEKYNLLKNVWQEPSCILDEFNHNQLEQLVLKHYEQN